MNEIYETIDYCPMCGESGKELMYYSKAGGSDDWLNEYEDTVPIVRCSKCGFLYSEKVLNEAAKERFFKKYASVVHEGSEQKVALRQQMYKLEFDYISKWVSLGVGIKVLDVGCAEGKFLDFFADVGCECHGVEVGEQAADLC